MRGKDEEFYRDAFQSVLTSAIEALRFYEKRGLLHPKRQSGNGYRVFEQADIQRISNIKRLKSQGFSLEEIQRVYSGTAQEDLIALYEQKILEMQRNINCYNHILARMQTACLTLKTAQEELMRPCRISLGRVYLLEYSVRSCHVELSSEGCASQAPVRGAFPDGIYNAHQP